MAVKEIWLGDRNFSVTYDIIRPAIEQKILFLHGWGSNKEIMKTAFADCFSDFGLIFLDMPGFGKSSNDYVLTTQDYANVIEEFLKAAQIVLYGVVGHSFGGKVACLLNIKRIALLGSSGIILPKPFVVRVKIAISKIAKGLGFSGSFRKLFVSDDAKDMSSVMYETFKNVVDEDFSHNFAAVNAQTVLVWGKIDTASPLQAGMKIASLIQNSILNTIDGDHYFFLKFPKQTQDFILNGWK